jgi:hypothetical protein
MLPVGVLRASNGSGRLSPTITVKNNSPNSGLVFYVRDGVPTNIALDPLALQPSGVLTLTDGLRAPLLDLQVPANHDFQKVTLEGGGFETLAGMINATAVASSDSVVANNPTPILEPVVDLLQQPILQTPPRSRRPSAQGETLLAQTIDPVCALTDHIAREAGVGDEDFDFNESLFDDSDTPPRYWPRLDSEDGGDEGLTGHETAVYTQAQPFSEPVPDSKERKEATNTGGILVKRPRPINGPPSVSETCRATKTHRPNAGPDIANSDSGVPHYNSNSRTTTASNCGPTNQLGDVSSRFKCGSGTGGSVHGPGAIVISINK